MVVGKDDNDNDDILPFSYHNNLVLYEVGIPSQDELTTLPMFVLTSDAVWNPRDVGSQIHSTSTISSTLLQSNNIHPDNTCAYWIISSRLNAT